MSNGPTVTVHGPAPRVEDFLRVFGTATVPVLQRVAVPFRASLPEIGVQDCYLLDLDRLDAGQRDRLLTYGVERFGLERADAERELAEHGFPILAAETTFISPGLDFL